MTAHDALTLVCVGWLISIWPMALLVGRLCGLYQGCRYVDDAPTGGEADDGE